MNRSLAIAGRVLGCVSIAVVGGWAALALFHLAPGGDHVRSVSAIVAAVIGGLAAIAQAMGRARRPALLAFGAVLAVVVVLWQTTRPSNDRAWQPDVAVLAEASFDGDLVTVRNIRNFEYRSETDFTPAYYDRTFDLRRLDRVDLIAVYWAGPAIAHLFVSFGFGDDGHLAISVEARKETTETYSSLGGFFRRYELIYVVGDERDLIRLRTNYRASPPEDVYVFRVRGTPDRFRRLFGDYLRDVNALRERPRFYNTLTTNCTTTIRTHTAVNPGRLPYSWKIMLSGYAPEYAYDAGRLAGDLPFAELMRRSNVNAAARAADGAPDFSRRIRAGLP
jgi:hypothetical protein